ncbi:hypothetical protein ACJVC5_08945 [Peredibacter sp. HCB2-198]|uniref:hypothetical protein n=1 Tax=Peredibacter sp. HCB2-198 TaxID=3383025 RepID=UPI0038B54B6C
MKILIFFTLMTLSSALQAGTTEELKRLNKCYGLFVRERIETDHPLWVQVSKGMKSGTDACMDLFDKAKLNNSGEIANTGGNYDYEGMRILNSFLRFHKSQFEIADFATAIGGGNDRFTRDVIDSNEAAYHFLYSLFAPDQKFSDTVTRDFSIRAKRYSEKSGRARSIAGVALQQLLQGTFKTVKDANGVNITVPDDAKGGVVPFLPSLPETGILIGLDMDREENPIDPAYFNPSFGTLKFTSTNVNQHLGGGLIGTQAYLLANLGKDAFTSGGTNLFRRWGKHVMSDLLCRNLPSLRSKDVIQEVNPESTIAFRTGISCMACHSSMDPLAGAIRNSRAAWSNNTGMGGFNRVKFIGHREPDLAYAEFPTKAADANFHRRPAAGRLYYRSYNGDLVQKEVEGLQDLGENLADTNDLYVCAAKRYYRYLTGINVDLSDIGNINTPVFSPGEKFQRDRVINLGLDLKKHQSLRTLIKNIIKSEAFIHPDRGV